MSHEDLLKAVMYVVHGSDNPCAAASRYSVSNRKILDIATKLGSVQEEQDTPLVESDNQQQIFRWVRIISTFHRFKTKHTQNGISAKHQKEEYWTSQAILRFLEILGYQSPL